MTDDEYRAEHLKQLTRIADALDRIDPPPVDRTKARQADIGDLVRPSLADLAQCEREAKKPEPFQL